MANDSCAQHLDLRARTHDARQRVLLRVLLRVSA
jgi:hypothetical protein